MIITILCNFEVNDKLNYIEESYQLIEGWENPSRAKGI